MKESIKPTQPKVLFLTQLPPPVHGASLMNTYLTKSNLISSHYDIHLISLNFVDKVSQIGQPSFGKFLKMLKIAFSLLRSLYNNKFDLVYFTLSPVGGAFYRDVLFVIILKLFNNNILYHLHGKGISNNLNSKIKKRLYSFVFNKATVICLSELLVYDIMDIHNGKIFIVPNGIPNLEVKPKVLRDPKEILYLSALKKSKGILDLIMALEILQNRNVSFSAKIVGGDTNDLTIAELKNILVQKNLESKVNVVGAKYNEEKWKMFASSGIFVFPTYYSNECFPLSILEAMMMGLVPVSTDNGAISEIIINGNNGFVVNQRDIEGLANCLEGLLNGNVDIKQIAQEAQTSFFEKYTLETFESKMLTVFDELTQR